MKRIVLALTTATFLTLFIAPSFASEVFLGTDRGIEKFWRDQNDVHGGGGGNN